MGRGYAPLEIRCKKLCDFVPGRINNGDLKSLVSTKIYGDPYIIAHSYYGPKTLISPRNKKNVFEKKILYLLEGTLYEYNNRATEKNKTYLYLADFPEDYYEKNDVPNSFFGNIKISSPEDVKRILEEKYPELKTLMETEK